jgi:hypothetical protein
MAQRKQLTQQTEPLLTGAADAIAVKENIIEECDNITAKCDTIIAKIKIKRAKND